MSRLFTCLFFLVFVSTSFCQKVFFVYLQSEAAEPFFIKVGEKTLGSTSGGYLILAELKDSSYQLKVGFPQNKWPDQHFSVDIKGKDRGYLLKNFGDKGWGLFDLQTMAVQMAVQNNAAGRQRELRELSAFTETLSKAANDPTLRYKPEFAVTRQEEKAVAINKTPAVISAVDTVVTRSAPELSAATQNEIGAVTITPAGDSSQQKSQTEGKPGNAVVVADQSNPVAQQTVPDSRPAPREIKPEAAKAEVVQQIAKPDPAYVRSTITKKSESSTTEGFGLTFIDQIGESDNDTIQILIPNPPAVAESREGGKGSKKFLEITDEEKDGRPLGSKPMVARACNSSGSQSDFLKLRKKMAGQKSEEAMIEEARKAFKAKCYSTEQIKNLGNLFLNEAAKFQFYEAVYPYSTDRDNFTVLQTELKDNYFIHRFRNLVKPGNL